MASAPNKRPRRNPLTQHEVAKLIEIKKKRELIALQKFKKTVSYKTQNVFNVICFFVYCEIILCFYGPCNYQNHYSLSVIPKYGNSMQKDGKLMVADMDFVCTNGITYNLVTNDFVDVPQKMTKFIIGKDFLLQKDLKGSFNTSTKTYRVFAASPILFLSSILLVVMLIAFFYNLNENPYPLLGLTILNTINMLGVVCL